MWLAAWDNRAAMVSRSKRARRHLEEDLERWLEEGEVALSEGDHAAVAERIARIRAAAGDEDARGLYLKGSLAWDVDGPEAALPALERAVAVDPDDADLRHALATAYQECGRDADAVPHLLQTRLLDAEGDREAVLGSPDELDLIAETAEEALELLPPALRDRLDGVPILLEPRPSIALVREGFDPRAYGLFEGPGMVDRGDVPAPTRIVLYTSNLLASFGNDDELVRQVEITVLHEVAHYFGFEEDEMEPLGLE